MSLVLVNPQQSISQITEFVRSTVVEAGKQNIIVAVSGGIDSALVLTLAVKAMGAAHVYPVFLPYKEQSTVDSHHIATWNGIPHDQWFERNIGDIVNLFSAQLQVKEDALRLGNIMARVRMIMVYDFARIIDALVCGTENKSEKHLGYFTRFGDAASDIEPIQHLYKTQVRQLAHELQLPEQLIQKEPSAELWPGQTDTGELGFSYEEADQVLAEIMDHGPSPSVSAEIRSRVIATMNKQAFKLQVPYILK